MVCKIFLLAFVVAIVLGSPGDRDHKFVSCVQNCEKNQCYTGEMELSLELQILLWDCPSECKYRCMHEITEWRTKNSLNVLQYYGKWPFIRVLGMQELGSVLFSIGNFLPHFFNFTKRRHLYAVGKRWLWSIYSILAMNLWTWSTVFHARDTKVSIQTLLFSFDSLFSHNLGTTTTTKKKTTNFHKNYAKHFFKI